MTAATEQTDAPPCVMCLGHRQFLDGLCVDCLTYPILVARTRYLERCSHAVQHSLDACCLFCDEPVRVVNARIFNTACHWLCIATLAAAGRREKAEKEARA